MEALFLSPSLGQVSGGGRVILLWAMAAAKMGWHVTIATPDSAPPWTDSAECSITAYGGARIRPDLVVATMWWTAWHCQRWARQGVPVLQLIQEDELLADLKAAERKVMRAALGLVRFKVCVSEYLAHRFARLADTVCVVPPALAIPTAAPRARWHTPLVLGLPFHAERSKGWGIIDQVVRGLTRVSAPLTYRVWGPGATAALHNRFECIEEPKGDRELTCIYDECDLLLYPSWREGFGLLPLEAMARGVAVVLTRCGGVSEYARHGVNCLMAEPGDVESLKHHILVLAESGSLRQELSLSGMNTAKEFTVDRFLRAARLILEKVVDTNGLQKGR